MKRKQMKVICFLLAAVLVLTGCAGQHHPSVQEPPIPTDSENQTKEVEVMDFSKEAEGYGYLLDIFE